MAVAKPTAKKKRKPPAAKQAKKPPQKTLPDGAVLDFSTLGLDDLKMTPMESRYVFWYTNPDYDTFQNKSRSAVKAGYKEGSARYIAYHLHSKQNIAEAIRRLMEPLKIDVKEEYEHIIRKRIARSHFCIADYYKTITIQETDPDTKKIVDRKIEVLKDLSELTPQQLLAVDGVDYKGMAGRKVYIFADRDRTMKDMEAVYNKLFGGPENDNNEDGEATMEIIKERLTVKITARRGKDEVSRIAGFVKKDGGNQLVEEL